MQDLHEHVSTKKTPQSEPIPGRESEMFENAAGGYTFESEDWHRFRRFLILGTEGGTYYTSERELTKENAKVLFRLLEEDGERVVEEIASVASNSLAPKPDPALFALAVASAEGSRSTRVAAYKALPEVAWTPTQLWQWAEYRKAFAGLGSRGFKRAVQEWYDSRDLDGLAYHLIKYRSRNGWSHRDILLLGHVDPRTEFRNELFKWATQHYRDSQDPPELNEALLHDQVKAFRAAKEADSVEEIVRLITDHRLPREAVPNEWFSEPEVWDALLQDMPIWAMLRNLGKMTSVGLISPMSEAADHVASTLTSEAAVRGAGVHPIKVLAALHTYSSGSGFRGSLSWNPVADVVDALDEAFYNAFGNVEPSGQRIVIGVDFSGSMRSPASGLPQLTCTQAAMALSLITANVESRTTYVGFTRRDYPLSVSPHQRLDDVMRQHPGKGEGTDCAVPMDWARKEGIEADAFLLLTDNMTWAGRSHPSQALERYRSAMGINARMVTMDMRANRAQIGDPNDEGHFHVVGFDATAPDLVSGFLRGEF